MARAGLILAGTATLGIGAAAAYASETIVYKYDARGRLVRVERTGTVNDNVSADYSYDKADNRTSVNTVSPNPPPPSPPPPPPPPPPPGNQPPVAVNDAGGMTKCVPQSFAVLANDSDPDNNLPLALVSVSYGGTRGTPSIQGTGVVFTPSGLTGTANVSYVMRDSLGATASATLTISITDGDCPPQ